MHYSENNLGWSLKAANVGLATFQAACDNGVATFVTDSYDVSSIDSVMLISQITSPLVSSETLKNKVEWAESPDNANWSSYTVVNAEEQIAVGKSGNTTQKLTVKSLLDTMGKDKFVRFKVTNTFGSTSGGSLTIGANLVHKELK